MNIQKAHTNRDEGFTLIEILIAIVVVGILSAVAVVGISSLTSKGGNSACTASADAAKAASVVHYANTGAYPTKLTDMTASTPAVELTLPTGITVNGAGLATTGATWTLTISGGGATAPVFTCT